MILSGFLGQLRIYNVIDSMDLAEGGDLEELPIEYLQSINIPSLPLLKLTLKVSVPIMLL